MKTLTVTLVVLIFVSGCCTTTTNPNLLLQRKAEVASSVIYNYYNMRCLQLTQNCSSRREKACLPLRICQRDRMEVLEKMAVTAHMFSRLPYLTGSKLSKMIEGLTCNVDELVFQAKLIQERQHR
jgi:hypothetical protein